MLSKKVILIAGACGRIGLALSKMTLKYNATVVLADINEKRLAELSKEFKDFKDKTAFVVLDSTSKKSINEAFESTKNSFGQVDAFVNATYPLAKIKTKPYYELEYEEICAQLNIHLGSFILASQEAVKFFKKQGYGNIINLSSIMGSFAPKFENYKNTNMQSSLEYSVIKAGINHLGVWLAKELFNTNIRVNTVVSGGILDKQNENFLQAYRACCASKGMLEADDVCGLIVFLLSDLSLYIRGQSLVVDDGWSL